MEKGKEKGLGKLLKRKGGERRIKEKRKPKKCQGRKKAVRELGEIIVMRQNFRGRVVDTISSLME